jgi:hypothetical protein
MFTLKILAKEAIPTALEKAERYRLLNEPFEAESICRDVLAVDPGNQKALITLLLALTDAFKERLTPAFQQAEEILPFLGDQFCKAYYAGVIYERRAKVHLSLHEPGSGKVAHEWLRKAMQSYEQALQTCSPGNQEALLRWNTCTRIIMQNPHVTPPEERTTEQVGE